MQWKHAMNSVIRSTDKARIPLVTALVLSCIGGCQVLPQPFTDGLAQRAPVTTPSVETARSAAGESAARDRGFAPSEVLYADGSVLHLPLYFEDPFEDKGSEDGMFAWTAEDYLQWVYWDGRFILNAVAFPVSAIVTPPWTVMASDGHLSRQLLFVDHDAQRWSPAGIVDTQGGAP